MAYRKPHLELEELPGSLMTRRYFLKVSGIGLAGVALLGPTACSSEEEGAQKESTGKAQKGSNTLVMALRSEPDNLNPIFEYSIYSGNKMKIFNGLLSYGKDLSQVPDLAAEMPEISPDGKTVTVRLREDVKFHDGEPFTAEDVVFTYNSILDPEVASSFRSRLDSVEEVKALGPHKVQFSLNRVDPAFLDKIHMGIVPKHLLEGKDLNTAAFNKKPVGTGPYAFKEWREGERIVAEANPDYFDGQANIPRVVFTFVESENSRAAVLENGNADVAGIIPRLAPRLRENDNLRVLEVPSADARFVPLPNKNPVLKDPQVRRALSLAVDREKMVEGVLAGAGSPAYGPIMRGHWAYSPVDEVSYDPDRARQMLEEAGWHDANGGGVREKDGTKLSFTLMYPAERSVRKDLALATRQDLAKVGVEVNVEGLGFDAINSRIEQDAAVYGLGSPYDPELEVYRLFHSSFAKDDDPSTNYANMINSEVDAALEAGRSTLNRDKRKDAYRKLQQALSEDGSYLYLVRLEHTVALSDRITGIDPQVEGHISYGLSRGVLWNLEDWELKPDG